MEIEKGDRFILHATNGIDYEIENLGISDYRPPDMKYAMDVMVDGKHIYSDIVFQGDDWFDHPNIKPRLEKVEG